MQDFILLGLGFQAWLTLVLIVGMFALLMKTRIPADVVFFCGMAVLTITGCLDVKEALAGFSSEAVAVVGALFVVVAGLNASGVLKWIVGNVLGQPKTYGGAIFRLTLPVTILTAFVSGAAVVALFADTIKCGRKSADILHYGNNLQHFKFCHPNRKPRKPAGVCARRLSFQRFRKDRIASVHNYACSKSFYLLSIVSVILNNV